MSVVSYASRRFVMPIVGLGETFYLAPLTAPEPRDVFAALGFSDVIVDYLVGRIAPMGRVTAEVAIAALYMFHPDGVRPHVPSAWELISPVGFMEVKRKNADVVLRRILGDWVDSREAKAVAVTVRAAAERCEIPGRPLTAGLSSQPWPDSPHLTAWHTFTMLREFRGDTHNAALAVHALDGAQAQQLMIAAGAAGCACHGSFTSNWSAALEGARLSRSWPQDTWSDATVRLQERNILDERGAITPSGIDLHLSIEQMTDSVTICGPAGDVDDVELLGELLQYPARLLRASIPPGIYDGFQMMT